MNMPFGLHLPKVFPRCSIIIFFFAVINIPTVFDVLCFITFKNFIFFPWSGDRYTSYMPWTLYTTMIYLIGVAIFCISMYRGTSMTITIFNHVLNFHLLWIVAVQMVFVANGTLTAGLSFMMLFVCCLCRSRHLRFGGRISLTVVCLIFLLQLKRVFSIFF